MKLAYWWALLLNNQVESCLVTVGSRCSVLFLGPITVPLEKNLLVSSCGDKLGCSNPTSGALEADEDPTIHKHLSPHRIPESEVFLVYILQIVPCCVLKDEDRSR